MNNILFRKGSSWLALGSGCLPLLDAQGLFSQLSANTLSLGAITPSVALGSISVGTPDVDNKPERYYANLLDS